MKAIVPAWRANSLSHNWFNEFDQVFETLFENHNRQSYGLACDVEEAEKYILFSFDLPGLKDEDLNIEVKDSLLVVSGERKQNKISEKSRTLQSRKFGKFKHHFKLPRTIDKEKIEADYSQGVLKVLLPKLEQELPKKIEVTIKKGNLLKTLLDGSQSKEADER